MSLTLEEISFIIKINNISTQIYRYIPIFLFLFGTIGNLMSCLVFTQREFRRNPCASYFLAASISNLIYLITLLLPILDAWNESFNLVNTISGLCKFTMLIISMTRTLSLWFIVLATIDRYLVSSSDQNRRQMSSLKRSRQLILIAILLSILIWAEIIYCFDTNRIGTPFKCYKTSDACHFYNDITLALIAITIPSILMFSFGLLTAMNIQQSRQRLHPIGNTRTILNLRSRRMEQSFTRMLLTQVFLMIILNLPCAIFTFYLTITFYQPKIPVQETLNGFILNILLLFPYISSCISFLLYTLTGKIFHQALIQLGKKMITYLRCQH